MALIACVMSVCLAVIASHVILHLTLVPWLERRRLRLMEAVRRRLADPDDPNWPD